MLIPRGIVLLTVCAAVGVAVHADLHAADPFEWRTASPATQGMDAAKLETVEKDDR